MRPAGRIDAGRHEGAAVIERALILATGPVLTVPIPQAPVVRPAHDAQLLRDVVSAHIRSALEEPALA
jgi:hypothetical protein